MSCFGPVQENGVFNLGGMSYHAISANQAITPDICAMANFSLVANYGGRFNECTWLNQHPLTDLYVITCKNSTCHNNTGAYQKLSIMVYLHGPLGGITIFNGKVPGLQQGAVVIHQGPLKWLTVLNQGGC